MRPFLSFSTIQHSLANGGTSCVQLVTEYLHRIENKSHLNAFVEVFTAEAIGKAQEVDKKIANSTAGKLAGMVVGIKDVLCYDGHRCSAASGILQNFESQYTGTAIEKLIAEDAIIIGRQNCDEFGMGSSNENSYYGPVKNGIDESLVPGGSSGGSSVAVQQNMCLVSLGSDTGGSVRQPAAFCGTIGLKPTYSRISRHGLIAYASSFDTIGIIANNIEDVSIVLETISGQDEFDSTVSKRKNTVGLSVFDSEKGIKVAYFNEMLASEGLDETIKTLTAKKLEKLRENGHHVDGLDFPMLEYLLPAYYIMTMAEASSNLGRFDGVRYGKRSVRAGNLEEMYKFTRSEGFGEEVKRRIMLGTFVLSASYYDAFYLKALKVRKLLCDFIDSVFEKYDFIVMPVTPDAAFPIGSSKKDPVKLYLEDIYTVLASLSGVPAVSIPNGTRNGLPVGIQVLSNRFEEEKLLAFSNYLVECT